MMSRCDLAEWLYDVGGEKIWWKGLVKDVELENSH
jgi:hypothetical protein